MKTLPVAIAAMLPLTTFAQEGVIVTSAPTIESGLNSLDVTLGRLIDKAEEQNQKLKSLVDSIGDPRLVTLAVTTDIKQDIQKSIDAARTNAAREASLRATTGQEAFGDNAYGLIDPVTATYTTKSGTVENRDPEKYRVDAALMKELQAYEEESKRNEERKIALLAQYSVTMEEMSKAETLSAVMKYKAMLDVIDSQVKECTNASLKAKQDYDVVKEKITVAGRISAKAKAEGRTLDLEARKADGQAAVDAARAAAAAAVPSTASPGWGPRTTTTTPPATTP